MIAHMLCLLGLHADRLAYTTRLPEVEGFAFVIRHFICKRCDRRTTSPVVKAGRKVVTA